MRTQVGIVGAGPAGLLLAHLLGRDGIESVVRRGAAAASTWSGASARACSSRARPTCSTRPGVGERMRREGMVHHGIELRFGGDGHRIDFAALTGGHGITVYGQQEVVKDLLAAREAAGALPLFECEDVEPAEPRRRPPGDPLHPRGRAPRAAAATIVAGCDGFHGVCRPSVPDGALVAYEREYPFAWLGILAEVAPSTEELIYARHERGFALHSMRSPELSRFYLQCEPRRGPGRLARRARSGTSCARGSRSTSTSGPIVEKGVTPMRSFVVEPMQSRPAVPGRRRRAHRPADRREGPEPRGRRRPRARRRAARPLRRGRRRRPARLLGHVPAPRLARRALLVVDDVDAPPLPGRRRVRGEAPALAARVRASARRRRRRRSPRTTSGWGRHGRADPPAGLRGRRRVAAGARPSRVPLDRPAASVASR